MSQSPGGGGFRFEDERPAKAQKFKFTVKEVTEADLARDAKEEARRRSVKTDGADPGRHEWPVLCVILILLPLVYWLQQWTRSLHGETLSTAPASVRRSESITDPGVSELTVTSKMAVKYAFYQQQEGERLQHVPIEQSSKKPDATSSTNKKADPPSKPADGVDEEELGLSDLDAIAWTRTDRLRLAMVAGELDGPAAALQRLEALAAEVEAGGELAAELPWMRMIYEKGPDALPPEAVVAIRERHGWFGRLATSFGRPAHDPERHDVAGGFEQVGVTIFFVQFGVIFASLLGIIGSVVALVYLLRLHRARELVVYERPVPGGSVYLETFGVFLGGFAFLLLIDLLFFGAGVEGTSAAAAAREILLWSLVGATLWPLVRGVRWREWLEAVGWNRGSGIYREVLAGILGYICSQPVVWLAAYIGHLVEESTGTSEPEGALGGYGLFDVPAEGSVVLFTLGILSAVVWAPLVEETIFRGALFRHLSGRMNLVWTTIATAALFGLIHPYTPSGIIQVASGGLIFGLMRAWRGSLIAPVTAHAIHNGVLSSFTVALFGSLG